MYLLQTQSLDRKLFYWFSFPLIIIAVSEVKNLNDNNRAGGAYESSICNVYSLQSTVVDVLYFSLGITIHHGADWLIVISEITHMII